jgi:putative ABC transport system permease protein
LGFNDEQLLKLSGNLTMEQGDAIKQALLANPAITQVSLSMGSPGYIMGYSMFNDEANGIDEVDYMAVDTDFLQTFGISLIKGRIPAASDASGVLINEMLYKRAGGGELDTFSYVSDVRGVVSDFNCKDLHYGVYPVVMHMLGNGSYINTVNVRLNTTDISTALDFIKKTLASFGNASFKYTFYDEWFDSMYKQEENQAKAIRIFTGLALLISCLGLFGLAEFHTRQKIKEIGIRRVNGATVKEILLHLNRNFLIPVLIAFVVACPIGWYVMHNWLQRFAYRADMSWWIFALAGLTALIVALLTVSWQSWRAATRNPVESLRYE